MDNEGQGSTAMPLEEIGREEDLVSVVDPKLLVLSDHPYGGSGDQALSDGNHEDPITRERVQNLMSEMKELKSHIIEIRKNLEGNDGINVRLALIGDRNKRQSWVLSSIGLAVIGIVAKIIAELFAK